jgi:recombination protein RecA
MNNDNELAKLLKEINKKADFLFKARDIEEPLRVSTGILQVDSLLKGGWPLKRTVTLYGREGSGKSTMAMYTIADAQARGMRCLWVDTENSFDASWAQIIGIDVDQLLVVQNRSLEHILDVVQKLKDKDVDIDIIVIDSISNIQNIKYFDDGSHGIGAQARATKELLSKFRYWFPKTLILCISQLTTVMQGQNFVSAPTGGNALRHESSFLLQIHYANSDQKKGTVLVGDRVIEREVAYVDMTWVFRKARSPEVGARGTFRFIPGEGIDRIEETFSEAVYSGVIIKRAGYYDYKDETIQGKDSFLKRLASDPDLLKGVRHEILEAGAYEFTDVGGDEGGGEGTDSGNEVD